MYVVSQLLPPMLCMEHVDRAIAATLLQDFADYRMDFGRVRVEEKLEFCSTLGNPRPVQQPRDFDPRRKVNFDWRATDCDHVFDGAIKECLRFHIAEEFALISARWIRDLPQGTCVARMPIRAFHKAMVNCFASNGGLVFPGGKRTNAMDKEAPGMACGTLDFRTVPPEF